MSCRQNNGNSASTSLAKFLTDSDEHLVSHIFHVARREAATLIGEEAKAPADISKVQDFLNDARSLARHDSRIPDARRESLIRRIDDAQQDLINGQVPNKATFIAWVELRDRLEAAKALAPKSPQEADPTAGFTREGIKITKSEVDLAKLDYERLSKTLEDVSIYSGFRYDSPSVSDRTKESINMREFEVRIAGEKYQKLSDAYDATETGYELLLADKNSNPSSSNHYLWLNRKENAEKLLAIESPMIVTLRKAEETGLNAAKENLEKAKAAVSIAEKAFKENHTPLTKGNFENASKQARQARRVYLYTVLERPSVVLTTDNNDMRSPQSWANLKGDDVVSQNEMWQAADLLLFDLDNAEARIGKIRDGEIARRAYLRAEARQALLDSQGNGEIDTINRRYNETIRRLRGESSRTLAG